MNNMKTLYAYLFDGWNSLRFTVEEMGKAIDRAMDVFPDE